MGDRGKEDIHYGPAYDEEEDIVELFQDERNMAALLLYKQGNSEEYNMDGTIGDDLVVKPAPASLARFVSDRRFSDSGEHWTNRYRNNLTRRNYEEEEEE